jgi:hypothetical protein
VVSMVGKPYRGPRRRRSPFAYAIVPSDRLYSNSEVVAPFDVVRRRAGNTATRVSSSNRRCLGDNCPSSAQTAPVGSRQLRLGRHSAECGLVGCSRAWWNDRENDHQSKLAWVQEGVDGANLKAGWGGVRSRVASR